MNPFETPPRGRRAPISSLHDIPLLPEPYIGSTASRPRLNSEERLKSSPQVSLPQGWKPYIHPKGWLYYANTSRRMVTDYNIKYRLDQESFEAALQVDNGLWNDVPDGYELWIDYGAARTERWYVCHSRRSISDKYPKDVALTVPLPSEHEADVTTLDSGTGEDGSESGETESSWRQSDVDIEEQLKQEGRYWDFMLDHPCHVPLPAHAEEDAIAALAWFSQDRLMNSEESLVPYSSTLSRQLLDLLTTMKDQEAFNHPRNRYVKTQFVASILERVAGERLRTHYGQNEARNYLKKQRRAHVFFDSGEPWAVQVVFAIFMTGVCFGAPYAYLRRINEFFITGFGRTETITERWQVFVNDNVQDWTNTNLVATVLISAAVVVLGIPDIDQVSRGLGTLSCMFAIASIVTGLLNVWQHQHESKTTLKLTVISDFFTQTERVVHTDKLLAILLSLPMVLLIWASLAFALSIVSFSWEQALSNSTRPLPENWDHWPWIVTGITAFLTGLVLTSVIFFWRAWLPVNNSHKKSSGKWFSSTRH